MNDVLSRYDAMAHDAAKVVIARYSTSFSAATRLLGSRVRQDITNLYAMVRIADEIVDGAATQDQAVILDDYEQRVLSAPSKAFHTDPILHAYAISARRCGFRDEHIRAFFASMRADLEQQQFDAPALERYIYGSAEVIGLLCLDAFLLGHQADRAYLDPGARALGRAFQKINFLRDLAEDTEGLGRRYYPALDKATVIAECREDLALAAERAQALPLSARIGVQAAINLYQELCEKLDRATVEEIQAKRIRVPNWYKLILAGKAVLGGPR